MFFYCKLLSRPFHEALPTDLSCELSMYEGNHHGVDTVDSFLHAGSCQGVLDDCSPARFTP